ncbi:hypothetical protein NFI96_014411 [Prochilodus magdalenae]|nr:hypothetical protein NFI96_014411 [Prochilodus magdalenae]
MMEELSSFQNLQALSALLSTPADEESDGEDGEIGKQMAGIGPGHIGARSPSSEREKQAGKNPHQMTIRIKNGVNNLGIVFINESIYLPHILTYAFMCKVNSAYLKKNTKDIWDVEEVTEETHLDDLADPRPQPEYEIILKQSVGTEDLFLGMSRKDPSSMCCESMLVRVKLPDTKTSDLMLDVKDTFLDLRTPKYKLGLHLPHPVHSGEGTAQFITERAELEITLPMNRPLDCINLV